MRFVVAFFLIGTLAACAGSEVDGDISAIDPNFFNLSEFVEREKVRLANTSITKTVSVNGIEETQEISKVDWELELAPFVQSNIDRPAMWDSYAVDSSSTCGGLGVITYTSLDSSNFTKSIQVIWSDVSSPLDSLYAVSISNSFDSYIANTGQRLLWWKNGYEIKSIQEAVLSEERELNIKGIWGSNATDSCIEELLKEGF